MVFMKESEVLILVWPPENAQKILFSIAEVLV